MIDKSNRRGSRADLGGKEAVDGISTKNKITAHDHSSSWIFFLLQRGQKERICILVFASACMVTSSIGSGARIRVTGEMKGRGGGRAKVREAAPRQKVGSILGLAAVAGTGCIGPRRSQQAVGPKGSKGQLRGRHEAPGRERGKGAVDFQPKVVFCRLPFNRCGYAMCSKVCRAR